MMNALMWGNPLHLVYVLIGLAIAWLLWPRKAEKEAPRCWADGERHLMQAGFRQITVHTEDFGKRRAWIREVEDAEETIVLLPGYAHQAAHYARLFSGRCMDKQVLVLDLNGLHRDRPEKIGRLSIGWKNAEVLAIVDGLRLSGRIEGKLTVVGHSIGGTFAPIIATKFPRLVGDLRLVTPFPIQARAVAYHLSYWWYALPTIPSIIRSIIWGSGVICSPWSARGLFTGQDLPEREFWEFYEGLVPESGWAFVQYILWYSGTKAYERAKGAGWEGRVKIIAAAEDLICRVGDLRQSAGLIDSPPPSILPEQPHCFFAGAMDDKTRRSLDRALQ